MLAKSCAALALWLVSLPAMADWPQFRGPQGSGVADTGSFPTSWDQKRNIAWKTAIPGLGWSSPVVAGNKIFLTTVVNDKAAPPRKGLYIADLLGKIPPGEHRWIVCCLDWDTGKILWQRTVHKGSPESTRHLKNSYASETPVTDGERLYAYFGNLGLFCFDMEGKPLWSKKWGNFTTRMGWGTGASPVLHKNRLYVLNDNEDKSFLSALDSRTGEEMWWVERDEKSTWSTPFVWENELRSEIVTAGTKKVRSYSLEGKLLWELAGMSVIAIPTPCAHNGFLYVSSGYILDTKRPMYAIRPGAGGDVSLKDNETGNKFIAWSNKLAGPYHPSPLAYGDHVYVLYDRGFLNCYDARTGKEVYRKRLDPGSDKFTASPVAANGKIYCLSEDGDTFVVKAGPDFQVLAKNGLDEMSLATPALVRDSILLRTQGHLYRIAGQ
jgi:outer membrane protein assembly factor BamB